MWRITDDFHSLFSEGGAYFVPIDGLRSISCLMIISVHLISLLGSRISPYPHDDWLHYQQSLSFRSVSLLTFSLETFFMISGFLLTEKFLRQRSDLQSSKNFFHEHFLYLVKRACRYWPGILLASLAMVSLGETRGDYASTWLFYQNYVSVDNWSATMGPLWSISLDMQMHVLLPVVLYFICSYRKSIDVLYSLYTLLVLSMLYLFFVFDPKTMDVTTLLSRYNSVGLMTPEDVAQWINGKYNITFPVVILHPNPLKIFFQRLYLPLFSRYSSFIIGSILAVKLSNVKPVEYTGSELLKKYFYFGFICFYMFILVLPVPTPDEEQLSPDNPLFIFFICCGRQLFGICQAFLLFSALCPKSHPYHSSSLKSILSFRVWSPIAKLSYLIYVLHYRIAFELVMSSGLFRSNRFSINYSTLLHLIVVFSICFPVAAVWHVLVERPFERCIDRIWTRKRHQN